MVRYLDAAAAATNTEAARLAATREPAPRTLGPVHARRQQPFRQP